jgi:nucleoside recognition membrane protein YjiH
LSGSAEPELIHYAGKRLTDLILAKSRERYQGFDNYKKTLQQELQKLEQSLGQGAEAHQAMQTVKDRLSRIELFSPSHSRVLSQSFKTEGKMMMIVILSIMAGLFFGVLAAFILDFVQSEDVRRRFRQALEQKN